MKQSLEDIIKKTDYNYLNNKYKPTDFSLNFINFVSLYINPNEENKTPVFHYQMLDSLYKNKNSLIISYRGSAKSTRCGEDLMLYLAVFKKIGDLTIDFGMYVSDTIDNGVKTLKTNLEDKYNKSKALQRLLPEVNITESRWEFTNINGEKTCFKGYGAGTRVRGLREYGKRPQIAIMDDLIGDKEANSKVSIENIENVIYKVVVPALHPTKRRIIWIGTPFDKKDPLYKASGTKMWNTLAFPICEKFPCTKEEFIGSWEDRFSYEAVKALYDDLCSTGRINAFNQEFMLRIMSDDDRLILDQDILWYNRTDFFKNLNNYHFYITTDFATSEKDKADYSVISVWALGEDDVFRWVDGIVERQDMYKNIESLFTFADKYSPMLVGIEVSGQQKGFIPWIKNEMVSRNKYFNIANDRNSREEGLRPNTSKLSRFNTVLPLFKQRKIMFPIELKDSKIMIEFIDELTSVTTSGFKSLHDDCLDTISQLSLIQYISPSKLKEEKIEKNIQYDIFDVFDIDNMEYDTENTNPYIV